MTDQPLAPTAPAPERRAYDAPALSPLGSIEAVTAGPHEGNLDQLFGGAGGFTAADDGTS